MVKEKKKMRWLVFAIPWLLTIITVALNLINGEVFNSVIMSITGLILDKFSWLFALVAFVSVILVATAYFTPFGNVRIGGRNAQPMMSMTNYIWIVICTIGGAGMLLWACAEPMCHYYNPPAHIDPATPEALQFMMKNLFLEWSFTPMCIYGMPAILFSFLFYNAKKEYSIGSMLYPCLRDRTIKKVSWVIDAICVLALVCGMSASMGSAVFLLSDGLDFLTNGAVTGGPTLWIIITAVIVSAFVASAISGILKGIRVLSTVNVEIYFVLGIFVFLFGPTVYILNLVVESFGAYLSDFCRMNLFISTGDGDRWAMWWPVFYWCNWMAWMPVSAVFLGKISKGFSIKEAIRVIVVYPSLFTIIWLGIFASSSIYYELNGVGINAAMIKGGPAFATYTVFQQLPLPVVSIAVFIIIVFISYVTASDSNTSAMSGLCTSGHTSEDSESPNWLKIVWGVTMGATCVAFLIAFKSTDAIKYLSNLGGFPVVFLMVLFSISFIKIIGNPRKYDEHKEDYTEHGRPIPSRRILTEAELKKQNRRIARAKKNSDN